MGAQKLNFFELFELRDYVVAKKSPDIEQKNDPARERPRFPSDKPVYQSTYIGAKTRNRGHPFAPIVRDCEFLHLVSY